MKKLLIGLIIALVIAVALGAYFIYGRTAKPATVKEVSVVATSSEKITLTYAVHWADLDQREGIYNADGTLKSKGLQQYLDEYTKLHPNITFNIKVIPYAQYADTLQALSDANMAPDIYQIYSPWGVSYVQKGILDNPPPDIKDDVQKNYISTAGVTINGQIWGIPTEIDDYVLLYNKDVFKEAGLVDASGNVLYPTTWSELVSDAVKLTKRDAKGNITRYGIAFSGEDWQVVDPFLSLLFSNGGQYLSPDLKTSRFNSAAGVEALNAELALFQKGATDVNGNFFDFNKDGKVAMVISPPWTKAGFQTAFGDKFESSVGVAPLPPIKNPATLSYSWFMGVMNKSQHKQAAWDFLKWFTTDIQPGTGTTRYGDLLVDTIGSIPSRRVDFESHQDVLGDFFTKTYVDQMKYAVAEPNVAGASDIKAALMTEIQAAWSGQKTATAALQDAATAVNKLLSNQ